MSKLHPVRLVCALAILAAASASALSQAQPEATTVEEVISQAMVPVPEVGDGAPLYTPLELQALRREATLDRSNYEKEVAVLAACYVSAFGMLPNTERMIGYDALTEALRAFATTASRAEAATVTAQEARVAAANGQATMAQVEQAELERQDAVTRMRKAQGDAQEAKAMAIDIQRVVKDQLPMRGWRGYAASMAAARARVAVDPWALVPEQFRDLRLTNIQAVQRTDAKGVNFISVSGAVENTRTRQIRMPPLSFTAVDRNGFTLVNREADVRTRLQPGETKPFHYDFKPSPVLTERVIVTFAGIDDYNYLEPATMDPVCARAGRPDLWPGNGTQNRFGPPAAAMLSFDPSFMMPGLNQAQIDQSMASVERLTQMGYLR